MNDLIIGLIFTTLSACIITLGIVLYNHPDVLNYIIVTLVMSISVGFLVKQYNRDHEQS